MRGRCEFLRDGRLRRAHSRRMDQHLHMHRCHYEVVISEDGMAWDVIDSASQEVVRLNDLPQSGLPESIAVEIAEFLNAIVRIPPNKWH